MADSEFIHPVRTLWADIFGRAIGDDEDFFDIGGDSLSAVNLVTALQQQLNLQMELEAFFRTPTIAGLAAYCATCKAIAQPPDRAIAST